LPQSTPTSDQHSDSHFHFDTNDSTHFVDKLADWTPQEIAEAIDHKCRVIFPCVFLLFNICYWIYLWVH